MQHIFCKRAVRLQRSRFFAQNQPNSPTPFHLLMPDPCTFVFFPSPEGSRLRYLQTPYSCCRALSPSRDHRFLSTSRNRWPRDELSTRQHEYFIFFGQQSRNGPPGQVLGSSLLLRGYCGYEGGLALRCSPCFHSNCFAKVAGDGWLLVRTAACRFLFL